jgi:hypothetical protein
MKLLKTSIAALGVVAMLAIPATTMAASPTADGFTPKETIKDLPNSNPIAQGDSQLTHNGWSVGGNKHELAQGNVYVGSDQTTGPGSRADLVQAALATDGKGSLSH